MVKRNFHMTKKFFLVVGKLQVIKWKLTAVVKDLSLLGI